MFDYKNQTKMKQLEIKLIFKIYELDPKILLKNIYDVIIKIIRVVLINTI